MQDMGTGDMGTGDVGMKDMGMQDMGMGDTDLIRVWGLEHECPPKQFRPGMGRDVPLGYRRESEPAGYAVSRGPRVTGGLEQEQARPGPASGIPPGGIPGGIVFRRSARCSDLRLWSVIPPGYGSPPGDESFRETSPPIWVWETWARKTWAWEMWAWEMWAWETPT